MLALAGSPSAATTNVTWVLGASSFTSSAKLKLWAKISFTSLPSSWSNSGRAWVGSNTLSVRDRSAPSFFATSRDAAVIVWLQFRSVDGMGGSPRT